MKHSMAHDPACTRVTLGQPKNAPSRPGSLAAHNCMLHPRCLAELTQRRIRSIQSQPRAFPLDLDHVHPYSSGTGSRTQPYVTMDGCEVVVGAGMSDIGIGVIAALAGSSMMAIGMVGQRWAHLRTRTGVSMLTQPRWWFFFLLFLTSNLGDAMALSFAPQSIITPLGSVSLVWNAIMARLLLGEKLDVPTILGGLFIICGVLEITIPTILRMPCSSWSVEALAARWTQTDSSRGAPFAAWAAVQLSFLALALIAIWHLERRMRVATLPASPNDSQQVAPVALPPPSRSSPTKSDLPRGSQNQPSSPNNSGGSDGVGSPDSNPTTLWCRPLWCLRKWMLTSTVLDVALLTPVECRALRALYPLASGLLASWTVLFSKCAGELGKSGVRMGNSTVTGASASPLSDPRTYALVCGVVFSAPLQLFYLNRALRCFEAQYVVPALQAFWCCSSIPMGALFFGEFNDFRVRDSTLFAAGVASCFGGVCFLSIRSGPGGTVQQVEGESSEGSEIRRRDATTSPISPIRGMKDARSPGGAAAVQRVEQQPAGAVAEPDVDFLAA